MFKSASPSPYPVQSLSPSLSRLSNKGFSKSLDYIFTFYAKQQKLVKLGGTFEDYKEDSTTLSIGEFLVFCKDFSLYTKEKLTKSELIEIFKVNCSFRKEMNEEQFEQTLRYMASKLFAEKSGKESYVSFLKFLGVDDFDRVKRRCKGFTQPFFSDKGNERGVKVKVRIPTDKNLPRVSKMIIQRFRSTEVVKKVMREEIIPCDAIITIMKKSGYAGGLKKVNSMACTWQTLSSLNTEQVVKNEEIFELIDENEMSDDEVLNRHYGTLKSIGKVNK